MKKKKTYLLLKSTLVLAKFFFSFFFAQLLINGKINIANKSTAMFCCSLIEYYSEKKNFCKIDEYLLRHNDAKFPHRY